MASAFSFLSKNRFALSLILLISLLLATLFVSKQPIPVFSLSLSTSSQLSLSNSSHLNHSNFHSNVQPSISPSFPPLPSVENSAEDNGEDPEKDERFIGERSAIYAKEVGEKKCDLYKGRWVRDEEGRYPLYAAGSCPYVDEAFSCRENGRQDEDYLKWRWKPEDCELPRLKF